MHLTTLPARRSSRALGVVVAALAAGTLLPSAAFAQDPAASPAAGGQDVLVVSEQGGPAEPVIITRSFDAGGSLGVMGGCGEAGFSVAGAPMAGIPAQQVTISGTTDPYAPQVMMGGAVMGDAVVGCGGDVVFGGPGLQMGPGVMAMGTVSAEAFPAQGGIITVAAEPSRAVTVTGVNGTTVSLETDDGWTRDLETGNVAITLDSDTLTAADLQVGDEVGVVQVRNANDTYTVTGLQLLLPQVAGTVSAATTDGFTLTQPDGTVTPVVVTPDTRWVPAGPGATTGADALKDGDMAFVRGRIAEDGTLTAHDITVAGAVTVSFGTTPGMPVPPVPSEPVPSDPAPAPEASPAG